jgi:hypothetical protein
MDPPDYQLIVIRAWREPQGLRIRLLANGSSQRQWVVGSAASACEVLAALLAELVTEEPTTRPHTTD